jgi:hypothetical protein
MIVPLAWALLCYQVAYDPRRPRDPPKSRRLRQALGRIAAPAPHHRLDGGRRGPVRVGPADGMRRRGQGGLADCGLMTRHAAGFHPRRAGELVKPVTPVSFGELSENRAPPVSLVTIATIGGYSADPRTRRENIDGRVLITERIVQNRAVRTARGRLPATMKILHQCDEPRCGSLRITM